MTLSPCNRQIQHPVADNPLTDRQDCADQTDGLITHWAVGMTTAPRQQPTLQRSLESLAIAGWQAPRIFAEPDVNLPPEFTHLPLTRRDVTLGAFPNWFLGLVELVMREPHADAYLMCQDDVVFCRGMREYLQKNLWPAPKVGVVSLYCPSHYVRGLDQGFHLENPGWMAWGALAYVFSNPALRALISSPILVHHRHHGPRDGLRNIDSIVGKWCAHTNLAYYVHEPSLAQHIGLTSTLYPNATARGRRRANDYVGEETDISAKQNPDGGF